MTAALPPAVEALIARAEGLIARLEQVLPHAAAAPDWAAAIAWRYRRRGQGPVLEPVRHVGGIRLDAAQTPRAPTPPPDINLEAWRDSVHTLRALDARTLHLGSFGTFVAAGSRSTDTGSTKIEPSSSGVRIVPPGASTDVGPRQCSHPRGR